MHKVESALLYAQKFFGSLALPKFKKHRQGQQQAKNGGGLGEEIFCLLVSPAKRGTGSEKGWVLFQSRSKIIIWILFVIRTFRRFAPQEPCFAKVLNIYS